MMCKLHYHKMCKLPFNWGYGLTECFVHSFIRSSPFPSGPLAWGGQSLDSRRWPVHPRWSCCPSSVSGTQGTSHARALLLLQTAREGRELASDFKSSHLQHRSFDMSLHYDTNDMSLHYDTNDMSLHYDTNDMSLHYDTNDMSLHYDTNYPHPHCACLKKCTLTLTNLKSKALHLFSKPWQRILMLKCLSKFCSVGDKHNILSDPF